MLAPRSAPMLFFTGVLTLATLDGCKKKDSGADPVVLDTPSLEFIGAKNTQGESFDLEDDEISIACDGLLTLQLGPEGDAAGSIANWTMKPAFSCGSASQCGYIRTEVLDAEGEALMSVSQAVASPLLDLSHISLKKIDSFQATLVDDEGEPFVRDDVTFVATWEVAVVRNCPNPDGSGGAMNQGGAGGAPPETAGAGGLGGLGGATDE